MDGIYGNEGSGRKVGLSAKDGRSVVSRRENQRSGTRFKGKSVENSSEYNMSAKYERRKVK